MLLILKERIMPVSMHTKTHSLNSLELDYERLHEELEKLENPERLTFSSFDIYSGNHPEYGPCHLILPSIGNGLLLKPFVTQ